MNIVFTYLPIRLNDLTLLYLEYSIKNLNTMGFIPEVYSDKDYLSNKNLKYRLVELDVEKKYLKNNLWSYPKLKTLSIINKPFIHFDNDFIIKDLKSILNKYEFDGLNLCYKHELDNTKEKYYLEILKKYKNNKIININFLNNTSFIGTDKFELVNEVYRYVLESIEDDFDFFLNKFHEIPPITLNQQFLNNFFDKINYIFESNPSYEDFDENGVCHLDNKNLIKELITHKSIL